MVSNNIHLYIFLEHKNHAKTNFSNFEAEIGLFEHFYSDLRICFFMWVYFSRDFLKAKQTEYSQARSSWVHVSEASPASERVERVTQIEQTKQIKHGACERSELRERASQAQSSQSGAV